MVEALTSRRMGRDARGLFIPASLLQIAYQKGGAGPSADRQIPVVLIGKSLELEHRGQPMKTLILIDNGAEWSRNCQVIQRVLEQSLAFLRRKTECPATEVLEWLHS